MHTRPNPHNSHRGFVERPHRLRMLGTHDRLQIPPEVHIVASSSVRSPTLIRSIPAPCVILSSRKYACGNQTKKKHEVDFIQSQSGDLQFSQGILVLLLTQMPSPR
ncbi:hypothetical protein VPH35_081423 [Triticum aestivum]